MANTRTGNLAEQQIHETLMSHGLAPLAAGSPERREMMADLRNGAPAHEALTSLGQSLYAAGLPTHRNIYGVPWRTDFFLPATDAFPRGFVLEKKFQRDAGSVDEKLPFVILSLSALDVDGGLAIDGGGARECAINWVRANTEPHDSHVGGAPFFFATFGEFGKFLRRHWSRGSHRR